MTSRLLSDEVAARRITRVDPEVSPVYTIEPEETESLGRITSQTILAAAACGYKGQMLKLAQDLLELSTHAQENTEDGHMYEQSVYNNSKVWLAQLNAALGLDLPTDLIPWEDLQGMGPESEGKYIIDLDCSLTRPDGMPLTDYFDVATSKTIEQISIAISSSTPAILRQALFMVHNKEDGADYMEVGRADLCIWTGKQFLIGDIKRSEEVLTAHALQLYFYARNALAVLDNNVEFLHPMGFIIHCATGYLFSRHDPLQDRQIAVTMSRIAVVDTQLVAEEFGRVMGVVNEPQADSHLMQYQKNCVECGYRNRCYPSMLAGEGGTPLALLPMDKSTLESLLERGVATAEALAQPDALPVLRDIMDKEESISAMQHRAGQVSRWKGYSLWMPKPHWREDAWLFAHVHLGRKVVDCWMDPNGVAYEVPPDRINFNTLVGYDLVEARKAYYLLGSKVSGVARSKIEIVTLYEDVRDTLHFPLPSYTLRALAELFRRLRRGETYPEIMMGWFTSRDGQLSPYEQTEMLEQTALERVGYLREVWLGLHWLGDELRTPLSSSVTPTLIKEAA